MNLDDFAGACTQTVLQTPASISADGNTAGVDVRDLKGKVLITINALNTAGSTPTYRVQTGDRTGVLYHVPVKLKGVFTGAGGCFGDIDGSFEVDTGDVAVALLDYGPCPGCSSDLDGTGEVDFGDVALILLSVGPCGG